MTPRTRKALELSIKHWERIVTGEDTSVSAISCALCQLFNPVENSRAKDNCRGCPVAQRTGRGWCDGSPYRTVVKLTPGTIAFRRAAMKELRFLESLRP